MKKHIQRRHHIDLSRYQCDIEFGRETGLNRQDPEKVKIRFNSPNRQSRCPNWDDPLDERCDPFHPPTKFRASPREQIDVES